MKHPFRQSLVHPDKCVDCGRSNPDHESTATCESCSNTSDCELVGTILMCAVCASQNQPSVSVAKRKCDGCDFVLETKLLQAFGPKMLCGVCLKAEYARAIQDAKERDKSVNNSDKFFTARTVAIVEVKQAIELSSDGNPNFDLHAFVRERFEHFSVALFKKSDEISSAQKNQQLVIELRARFQEQIKTDDANYQPPIKVTKVKVPTVRSKASKEKDPIKRIYNRMASEYVAGQLKKGIVITMQDALKKIESDFS